MSELNIRQSKEIKRLKQQVKQFDVIVAARDSALKELQDAHKHLLENAKIISQTKGFITFKSTQNNKYFRELRKLGTRKEQFNK